MRQSQCSRRQLSLFSGTLWLAGGLVAGRPARCVMYWAQWLAEISTARVTSPFAATLAIAEPIFT